MAKGACGHRALQRRSAPGHDYRADRPGFSFYSEPMRFPAYCLSKMGEVIRAEVVELSEEDLPAGDVLVNVEWSAVNFKDAMVTRPGNRVARGFPLVPGVELDRHDRARASVPTLPPGQRVLVQGYDLGVAHHGGFAGYARVPADWIVPLPRGRQCRTAAIIGLAGFTAVLSLHRLEHHGLTPDDGPVLVTGASGGVGSTTVALLAHRGFEVVASSGKEAEHEYLMELGATRVVGRRFSPDDDRTLGPQLWGAWSTVSAGTALSEALRTVRYGGAVAASGLTGGNQLPRPSTRSSSAVSPCSASTPWPPRSTNGGPCGTPWPRSSRSTAARTWSARSSAWTVSASRWTGCSTLRREAGHSSTVVRAA